MNHGYIKIFRSVMDKGWANKPDYVSTWLHLLMLANFREKEVMVDGSVVTLNPGQFLTSRKKLSYLVGVSESKIQRILSLFENEQQIEQVTTTKYRIISITKWHKYQMSEQPNEQQMNSQRTADERPVNTTKECKKEKNERKEEEAEAKPQPQPPEKIVSINNPNISARFFQLANRQPNAFERNLLVEMQKTYTTEELTHAFKEAGENGVSNLKYVKAILEKRGTKKPEDPPPMSEEEAARIRATLEAYRA